LFDDEKPSTGERYQQANASGILHPAVASRARYDNKIAKAINYMLSRWASFARFVSDGRICMTNNAAERRVRTVAVGRRNWTFCGSDRGGDRAAAMYTLIQTCRLNDVDPHAWLRDVIAQISDHPQTRLHELLPW
jgi:transposase